MDKAVPSFQTLCRVEPTFQRALTVMALGLMLAVGIWWVIQPAPNAVPTATPSPEVLYAPWISAGGALVTVLAGIVLLRRYLLVKQIICQGTAVKGTVELADRFDTNTHNNSTTMQTTPTYVYYVTVRYALQGTEQKVRLRLPHSPGTYGIKKGGEVDLLVLDSVPQKPLLRAVYLGRTATRSG